MLDALEGLPEQEQVEYLDVTGQSLSLQAGSRSIVGYKACCLWGGNSLPNTELLCDALQEDLVLYHECRIKLKKVATYSLMPHKYPKPRWAAREGTDHFLR